ncbi:MAG: RES domain-containing protein [Flavobacteriales bacterium]|nr:MAG: RES domain-containing protein [Flavobacteriales bacterium]
MLIADRLPVPQNYEGNGHWLFRAQGNSEAEPVFKHVERLSICPDYHAQHIAAGRCNRARQPLFYACNQYTSACLEALTRGFRDTPPNGVNVTCGQWGIREPLVLARIGYDHAALQKAMHIDPVRYQSMIEETQGQKDHVRQGFALSGAMDPEVALEMLEIFTSEFAKTRVESDGDYSLSILYADRVLNHSRTPDGGLFDGVVYPSVSSAYQELNVALHPRAMKKIGFRYAYMSTMAHFEEQNVVRPIPLDWQVVADTCGTLLWKKV